MYVALVYIDTLGIVSGFAREKLWCLGLASGDPTQAGRQAGVPRIYVRIYLCSHTYVHNGT